MRLALWVVGAAALGAWGCKPPPKEKLEDQFKSALRRHFDRLNGESLERRDRLRMEREAALANPALRAPAGTVVNIYEWDPEGFVVAGFPCQTCGAKLLMPHPWAEYRCRACGHSPYLAHRPGEDLRKAPCDTCMQGGKVREPGEAAAAEQIKRFEGAAVKPMYEPRDANPDKGILRATVRYVRRVWAFDERGTVPAPVSAKVLERAPVDANWFPSEEGTGPYNRPGFHRPDEEWVGEITFEFKGGELTELSRRPEEPVRPWKGIRSGR
jgi:hypothetical protein